MEIQQLSYFISLSAILEAMPDALVIITETGCIILVNKQTENLFGYKRTELLGKQVEKLIPDRFRKKHVGYRNGYFANPQVRPMGSGLELFGLKKDNTEFPVEISLSPLKTEIGLYTLAAIRDISERKKTEEAKTTLSAIVEHSDEAIIGNDLTGTIISWNKGAEQLYGYSSTEAIGRNIEFIFPTKLKGKYQHIVQKIKLGMSVNFDETERVGKNGKTIPVSVNISPIKNTKGEIIGASSTTRNITEQKQLREQLRAKNAELENASLAKDRFLASMSHELRTPLNAIIGFTGTLLMQLPGPLNADQDKQLKIVETSAKHLLSIINDILDVAKIESGKVEINLEEVNCKDVVKEIISTFTPIAESKHIHLKSDIPTSEIYAFTDRRVLTQILINLVNNAIKFTEQGYIEIKMNYKKEFVVIAIIDTGYGIKKEDQEKLFRAFEQIEMKGAHREGTGLGLYLSQKLLSLINGKIEFESEYGKGSRFSIVIPKKIEKVQE